MTYTKLGDEFPAYADGLSDAAFRLHVEALLWSSRMLLDLSVPKSHIRRLTSVRGDVWEAINELVESGWWEDSGDDSWHIGCRFPEWQMTREWVEHQSKRNREKQARFRGKNRELREATSVALTAGFNQPSPTQPNPTQVTGNVTGYGEGVRACCDDPALTMWRGTPVCRTCGSRGVA